MFHIECHTSWGCKERDTGIDLYSDAGVRVPLYVNVEDTPDRHMTIIDEAANIEWDFWHVHSLTLDPNGIRNVIRVDSAGRNVLYGKGIRKGTTASHFANLAGRIRAEEMSAGVIDHALYVTIYCTRGDGGVGNAGYVHPANYNDQLCALVGEQSPYDSMMGAHFYLMMTPQQIDALPGPLQGGPIQDWKKVVLKAMAKYGMYVGDTGSRTNALELENGNMYLACGYPDRWRVWVEGLRAQFPNPDTSGWTPYQDPTTGGKRWIGKLSEGAELWVGNLRMVDPLWAQTNCPP